MDVVVDLVTGPQRPELIDVLKHGERYAVAGTIADPIIRLEIRTLYLKDLNFFGCAFQEDIVFENLIRYIEADEIHPVVSRIYPLKKDHIISDCLLSEWRQGAKTSKEGKNMVHFVCVTLNFRIAVLKYS